jgi:hypothetical protein
VSRHGLKTTGWAAVAPPTVDAETAKSSAPAPERASRMRTAVGVVLFVAWGVATFLWLASTVDLVAGGDVTAAVTALLAVALLGLLAAMEGLEVSVIDRWQTLWPGRSPPVRRRQRRRGRSSARCLRRWPRRRCAGGD